MPSRPPGRHNRADRPPPDATPPAAPSGENESSGPRRDTPERPTPDAPNTGSRASDHETRSAAAGEPLGRTTSKTNASRSNDPSPGRASRGREL